MQRAPLVLLLATVLACAAAAQDTSRLGDDVRDLFIGRCASCHGADVAKPKGRFGYVEDLARVAEEFVVPGEPDESDLWLLVTDPDEPMPPRDAPVPPLTLAELALVRWWIVDGARPPSGASAAVAAAPPGLRRSVARIHPLVVHFPIALLMAAALAGLLALRRERDRWRPIVGFCLLLGTAGGALAVGSGFLLAPAEGFSDEAVFGHRWLGVSAAAAAALATLLHFRFPGRLQLLYRALLLATAILVAAAGHYGGLLAYGPDYL